MGTNLIILISIYTATILLRHTLCSAQDKAFVAFAALHARLGAVPRSQWIGTRGGTGRGTHIVMAVMAARDFYKTKQEPVRK